MGGLKIEGPLYMTAVDPIDSLSKVQIVHRNKIPSAKQDCS